MKTSQFEDIKFLKIELSQKVAGKQMSDELFDHLLEHKNKIYKLLNDCLLAFQGNIKIYVIYD